MQEIEIERVFLIKTLPADLKNYKPLYMNMGDFYDPNKEGANKVDHLNIRQKGDTFEIRKKEGDSKFKKIEHNISITKEEFETLMKAAVQKHTKNRYLYPINDNLTSEIDLYQGKLAGYARVEVEFKNEEEMHNFTAPDWFGIEITEINHSIHKNLGLVNFDDMQKRYKEKNIELKSI